MGPLSLSRRHWLKLMGAAPMLASAQSSSYNFPGKRSMLVQNDFPEDLESLPEYFETWITPNDAFFVRQHLPRPKVEAGSYKLAVGGLVSNKLSLTLDDLRKLPQQTVPATLECAGNGRAYYRPRVPGIQWSKGAIGNAEWRGPRVAEILKRAGVESGAAFVDFDGADSGVAKTPDFVRSLPLRKMMHESTILALQMNGQPIPDLHGFPARLIVPGWDGASWVKWVTGMTAVAQQNSGFYMNPAYRYPKHPTPPGVAAKPDDLEVIEGMRVKSFFTTPSDQAKVANKAATLKGVAWAGEEKVARVEISVDGGSRWQDARLGQQNYNFAWRLFTYEWTPSRPGYHLLMSRATDSAGHVQPVEPLWNPSGYLWNAIDRIGVLVEAS